MMLGNVSLIESAPLGPVPLGDVAVLLHPDDDVAIAKVALQTGTVLAFDGQQVAVQQFISSGHKVALRTIEAGAVVRRYGHRLRGCGHRPRRTRPHA